MRKLLKNLKSQKGVAHFLILALLAVLLGVVTLKASNLSQYIPFLNSPAYNSEELEEAEEEYEEDDDLDDEVYELDGEFEEE